MAFKSWEFWLALKYVFSPKRERFTGIISVIAVIGVCLSVCALTVVSAVMTGFKDAVLEKVLGFNPHISIAFSEKSLTPYVVKRVKEIIPAQELKSISPFFQLQGLVIYLRNPQAIVLKGIDLSQLKKEKAFEVLKLSPDVEEKHWERDLPLILGEKLAKRLGVRLGSRVKLLSVEGIYTIFGFFPKVLTFKVVGVFKTGVYDYDQSLGFTSYETFLKKAKPSYYGIELKLKDPFKAHFYKEKLSGILKGIASIIDWQEWNRNLFAALKLEKAGLFVVLTLMVVVSLFTILAAMIMLVTEKKVDIAIIKAMGGTPQDVLRIFFYCGLVLSLVGVILGMGLGLSICLFLSKVPVVKLPSDVYPVEYLPVKVQLSDLALIALTSVVISVLACLYPAKKAAKLYPAEILRQG